MALTHFPLTLQRSQRTFQVGAIFLLGFVFRAASYGAGWESTLTVPAPNSFPVPRAMHARYGFGWSGIPGATLDVRLTKPSTEHLQVDAGLHTTGAVRALWKFDASHTSITDAKTLHPVEVIQTETARAKKIVTSLTFDSKGATSKVVESPSKNGPKNLRFDFPNLLDLQSSLFYLRSQSLPDRSVQRIVVYPATSAYLATITVLGRERVTVPAGGFNAIKLDLELSKIGKDHELQPHRKFRRATAWISDDPDRLLLRIEAQVFVGTVFVELQTVEFDEAKMQPRAD